MTINNNLLCGLDFETYSAVDLNKHGLENYVNSPTFKPLMAHAATPNGPTLRWDFVLDNNAMYNFIEWVKTQGYQFAAHNAGFEKRVLEWMGVHLESTRFVDSAAVARAMGVAGKLEAAAPQLLNVSKLETGKQFIKTFCVPGPYQALDLEAHFDPQIVRDRPDEWDEGHKYCGLDARLSRDIVRAGTRGVIYTDKEHNYESITMDMNSTGWHVDVPMVQEMNRRYLENKHLAEAEFRIECNAPDLNLNSLKQLKEWCAERGIKANSFDEKAVARLIETIKKRIERDPWSDKADGYAQVLKMLKTKQVLGGSSLKKLEVILNTVAEDSILRDQYVHIGAGQSYRTTGRSVQMQNLKRIGDNPDTMEDLNEVETEWDNEQLARNLRQSFTARDPKGFLIVGDFSSVEARGLAWEAQELNVLEGYRQGLDAYKVLAANIYGKRYELVTKPERQTGKVGVLSCGYGAGPDAVQSFAAGMGIEMTEGEAVKLVTDWRAVNPRIVGMWNQLDEALHRAVELGTQEVVLLGYDQRYSVSITPTAAPQSLVDQCAGAKLKSLQIQFRTGGRVMFQRFFHGVYSKGRGLIYFKPTETKNGDLWKDWFINPKTKQKQHYSIYGGKLTGILTQSLCRELFFESLYNVNEWVKKWPGLHLVGQFHDEIVLDWSPTCDMSVDDVEDSLQDYMSSTTQVLHFPLAADIKRDYRYTK